MAEDSWVILDLCALMAVLVNVIGKVLILVKGCGAVVEVVFYLTSDGVYFVL